MAGAGQRRARREIGQSIVVQLAVMSLMLLLPALAENTNIEGGEPQQGFGEKDDDDIIAIQVSQKRILLSLFTIYSSSF